MDTFYGIAFILGSVFFLVPGVIAAVGLVAAIRKQIPAQPIYMSIIVLFFLALAVCMVIFGVRLIRSSRINHYSEIQSWAEFQQAMKCANQASKLINNGTAYSVMTHSDSEQMLQYYRDAIAHATQVDTVLLNRTYSDWGNHFQNDFIAGVKLLIEGIEQVDATKSMGGQNLIESWSRWYNANRAAIHSSKLAIIQ